MENWKNLIYTYNAPDATGWSLRGQPESLKSGGWFDMIILSTGCSSQKEAWEEAEKFVIHRGEVQTGRTSVSKTE